MRISDWSSDVCSSDLAAHRVDAVIVDLGEDDLFLEAHGIVATTIEAFCRHAAKVADARHRDGDQAIEELVHPLAAQGDLAADRHAFAQHETGDRLLRLGNHGLLPRRSEEHTSELQSLMRISYAVFCLKKNKKESTDK